MYVEGLSGLCVSRLSICPNKLNIMSRLIKLLVVGLFELKLLSPARVTIH